jgi:hypothetical protein
MSLCETKELIKTGKFFVNRSFSLSLSLSLSLFPLLQAIYKILPLYAINIIISTGNVCFIFLSKGERKRKMITRRERQKRNICQIDYMKKEPFFCVFTFLERMIFFPGDDPFVQRMLIGLVRMELACEMCEILMRRQCSICASLDVVFM